SIRRIQHVGHGFEGGRPRLLATVRAAEIDRRKSIVAWGRCNENFSASTGLCVAVRRWDPIRYGTMCVSPFEVDQALLLHPDVAAAAAFPVPDGRFGETVAAAVVLRDGASVEPRDLKWFAFTHLATHKVPQRILFVDSIPKLARRKLAGVFGLGSVPVVQTLA